jgi:chorismate mutase
MEFNRRGCANYVRYIVEIMPIQHHRVALAAAIATALAVLAPQAHADDSSALVDLVDAAAQRLQTAEPIAAIKWKTNAPVEDPPRVQQVLAGVAADATAHHIDPGYVDRVFTDQINATDAIEYTRFAQWKLDPPSAPVAPPDLSASRSVIDGVNRAMVDKMALHWDLLHSPECAGGVDNAKSEVVSARQLDTLYQQALSFATRSYCSP